jgi:hypothetical protein
MVDLKLQRVHGGIEVNTVEIIGVISENHACHDYQGADVR